MRLLAMIREESRVDWLNNDRGRSEHEADQDESEDERTDEGQGEGETTAEPGVPVIVSEGGGLEAGGRGLKVVGLRGGGGFAAAAGGEAADAFGVVFVGVFDRGQGIVEFGFDLGAGPLFGLEIADDLEVAGEGVAGDGDFFDEFLGVVQFAIEAAGAAGEFFEDIAFSRTEEFLFLAEFFEVFLFALDFLLLLAELGEALLGGFDLVIDVIHRIFGAVHEAGDGFEAEDVVFFVSDKSGRFACHSHIGNYFLYGYITEVLNIPVFSSDFLRGCMEGLQKGG